MNDKNMLLFGTWLHQFMTLLLNAIEDGELEEAK